MSRLEPAPGAREFLHEAAVYHSDEEMVRIAVDHLRGAGAPDETAVAVVHDAQATLLQAALQGEDDDETDDAGVVFLPTLTRRTRPPQLIAMVNALVAELVTRGVSRVRVVSTTPHPGVGAPWDGWSRYEAAINDLLSQVPVSELCLYDGRITPEAVLHDVAATHPRLSRDGEPTRANGRYQRPTAFLEAMPDPPLDPLEAEAPAVELHDPAPADARRVVHTLAGGTELSDDDISDVITATSEAVTNARLHGRPPVTLRAWAAQDRIIVAVTDRGEGPQDPYAGLQPRNDPGDGPGGFGLWLIHHLSAAVTYTRQPGSFTIHLTGGQAPPLYHADRPAPVERD